MTEKRKHAPIPWIRMNRRQITSEDIRVGLIAIFYDHIPEGTMAESNIEIMLRAINNFEALLDALKTWKKFWDTMPSGQMGNLSFDVGLLNDGFLKMEKAIADAEKDLK